MTSAMAASRVVCAHTRRVRPAPSRWLPVGQTDMPKHVNTDVSVGDHASRNLRKCSTAKMAFSSAKSNL